MSKWEDPADYDYTCLGFKSEKDRDIVLTEAKALEDETGGDFRVWTLGPLLFYAGPIDVVLSMDAWVQAKLDEASAPSGPVWAPDPDVDA